MSIYLFNDGRKGVVSYIQDYISKRKIYYPYDWNAYIQFNNIMQFIDTFISISQRGLDEECYAILESVKKDDEEVSNEWQRVSQLVIDPNAKDFIRECIRRNILPPTVVGFELETGEIAELYWNSLNVVYLTNEQLEYKDIFINEGFEVVNSIEDFEKITSE